MSKLHAMPVMLGVLAILAVAYRYYSAFLAARVAALDDSRVTPAVEFADGQNFHPTNRWVLFGHHFAAISGAGPLIGPVLAIQFGYMPGLVWLVVGVCLAGAVQDMMVLASSVRRGGKSLAALARQEIGPVAGMATTLAILYVIIIALAGLGIVVVKALGGEEVAMKAGDLAPVPGQSRSGIGRRTSRGAGLRRPARRRPTATARGRTSRWSSTRGSACRYPRSKGPGRPEPPVGTAQGGQAAGAGKLVGGVHDRLHGPDRPGGGLVHVPAPQGKVLEASILGAALVLGATVLGGMIPGFGPGTVFLVEQGDDDLRHRRLRVRRGDPAGLAPALPARLPVELPQDRHDRLAGGRGDRGEPDAGGADGEPPVRLGGRALLRRADLPVRLHLHHVRRRVGVPRPGRLGHDAQDGRPRARRPDDRLRGDADGRPGRDRRPDRGGGAAELDVLRHQHRPRPPPPVPAGN